MAVKFDLVVKYTILLKFKILTKIYDHNRTQTVSYPSYAYKTIGTGCSTVFYDAFNIWSNKWTHVKNTSVLFDVELGINKSPVDKIQIA